MRFQISVQGDVAEALQRQLDRKERQVTQAVAAVAREVQQGFRQQITGAGLGLRLARTVRAEAFPKGGNASLDAAANIWTKAPHIVGAFNKGVVIRARDGFWLAIPTEDAGKSTTRGRITPNEWMARHGVKLRPVIRPGRPVLLVAEMRARSGKRGGFAMPSESARRTGRGLATVVIFVLIPQARLTKRLDFQAEVQRGRARLVQALSQLSQAS